MNRSADVHFPAPRVRAVSLKGIIGSLLVVAAGLASGAAQAADYTCEVPGDKRHLRLDIPGQQHLCEVSVTPAGGERRVLWYADNSTLFCSDKTVELVQKYTEQWGFECSAWPTDDDLSELNNAQREQLDTLLRERRRRPDGGPDSLRVAVGPVHFDGSRLIAVQWLGKSGERDALNVVIDSSGDQSTDARPWQTVAYIENLISAIDQSEATVQRAIIQDIDRSGAVRLSTVVESASGASDAPPCRGQQLFAIDPRQGLTAVTPHRYSCAEDLAKG